MTDMQKCVKKGFNTMKSILLFLFVGSLNIVAIIVFALRSLIAATMPNIATLIVFSVLALILAEWGEAMSKRQICVEKDVEPPCGLGGYVADNVNYNAILCGYSGQREAMRSDCCYEEPMAYYPERALEMMQ